MVPDDDPGDQGPRVRRGMSAERWREVSGIVDAALDLAPEHRPAFISRVCPSDATLRAEVEQLLSACDRAGGFLGEQAAAFAAPFLPEPVGRREQSHAAILEQLRGALTDRYVVEREVGHGGTAIVYLARDVRHRRAVAIKVLRPELAVALGAERFLREIDTAANLAHPHVLPLLDSGEADGLLYYVMPYVEGESLRARLERERQLPVGEAVRIAREVAGALDYVHRHNVLHRDLKPENILLIDGQAVVGDFGIARAISRVRSDPQHGERSTTLTATGVSLGTPTYMSPEQASGDRPLDGRSDIYALGCVLFEMLAGRPPFTGPTAESVVRQHTLAPPPALPALRESVPSAVTSAIGRALAKSPGDRFQTALQFAAALEASGETADTTLSVWASALRRVRKALIAVTALALITAGVIAASSL